MQNRFLSAAIALIIGPLATACAPSSTQSDVAQARALEIKSFALINDEVTETIANQMQLKCDSIYSSNQNRARECRAAASHMAKALDFNYIKRSDGQGAFVFMSSRLKDLLATNQTLDFLAQIQTASEDALYLNKPFNLWDLAMKLSGGQAEVATERIAVLFQDGAETAAQIKFLLIAQHPSALQLAQTVQTFEEALKQGKATAFPAKINLTRTAHYHYYVPRYLAQKLRALGTSASMAAQLPFLFNSSYELHQIQKSSNPSIPLNHRPVRAPLDSSPDTRKFVEQWNSYDELYSDLLDHLGAPLTPFKTQGQQHNLEDLYLGYAGALAGATPRADQTDLEFSLFVERFSADPQEFFAQH